MKKASYEVDVILSGITPLLMHQDDVDAADRLEAWRKDPANKNLQTKGDDRSPPWTWHSYLYTDGEHLAIPIDNLMACLRDAGAKVILKKQTTLKSASQSGLFIGQQFADFFVAGKQIPAAAIYAIRTLTFPEQKEAVKKLGFTLFAKRARVGQAKHVRVRPRFDSWKATFTIEVLAPEITKEHLISLLDVAGDKQGLCDWRPGPPKGGQPGRFGRFVVETKFHK